MLITPHLEEVEADEAGVTFILSNTLSSRSAYVSTYVLSLAALSGTSMFIVKLINTV